ncbi:hypothetical protein KGF56_000812 [Candida oxycetoniae]|uniref:Uncharacterized protein n=1 Tax=Candida oxycetoniae TaxID=497107 RepID=A0AAI9T159_9ASCO|nr:uncharacterized protein KGF56_000812 [Candida oxycetoniae]KAI3406331.2 hypothetical protein KGF56_000812 [Candida oxycetoniae]
MSIRQLPLLPQRNSLNISQERKSGSNYPLSSQLFKHKNQPLFSSDLGIQGPPMSQASLNRLEVETTSTTSLPISYPYLHLEGETSTDTFGVRQDNCSKISTQHQHHPNMKTSSKNQQPQQQRLDSTPLSPIEDVFNQVPKRFSHFVVDQQNPHVSQRLDNLSIMSPSFESLEDEDENENDANENTTQLTKARGSNLTSKKYSRASMHDNQEKKSGQSIPPANSSSRDISDSMGSQATIFSTRLGPESEQLLLNNKAKSINDSFRKTKSLFNKNRTKRTSTVRVYRDITSSLASSVINSSRQSSKSLTRKNAIKSKQGSWFYRMKLRIKKLLTKLKFYSFKASSPRRKKSVQSLQRARDIQNKELARQLRRSTTTTLVRKERANPQNRDLIKLRSNKLLQDSIHRKSGDVLEISNPSTNPRLGKQPVYHVRMNSNVKKATGAGLLGVGNITSGVAESALLTSEEIGDENVGKYHHLSNYINQQENNYLRNLKIKRNTGANANTDNMRTSTESYAANYQDEELPSPKIDSTSESNTQPSVAVASSGVSSSVQNVPAPPPHIDTSYIRSVSSPRQRQRQLVSQSPSSKQENVSPYARYTFEQLWQSYLKQVLSRRILLRHEINQFQNFMATKETSNMINQIFEQVYKDQDSPPSKQTGEEYIEDQAITGSTVSCDDRDHLQKESDHNTASSIYSAHTVSTSSTDDHGDIFVDPQDEEFETKVLNRRSMLGAMLEYQSSNGSDNDSDDDSQGDENEWEKQSEAKSSISTDYSTPLHYPKLSTLRYSSSIVSSRNGSEIMQRKYGTILRKPSKAIAKKEQEQEQEQEQKQKQKQKSFKMGEEISSTTPSPQSSVIRRSIGLRHSLSQLR